MNILKTPFWCTHLQLPKLLNILEINRRKFLMQFPWTILWYIFYTPRVKAISLCLCFHPSLWRDSYYLQTNSLQAKVVKHSFQLHVQLLTCPAKWGLVRTVGTRFLGGIQAGLLFSSAAKPNPLWTCSVPVGALDGVIHHQPASPGCPLWLHIVQVSRGLPNILLLYINKVNCSSRNLLV